jgi:hypothetical protein
MLGTSGSALKAINFKIILIASQVQMSFAKSYIILDFNLYHLQSSSPGHFCKLLDDINEVDMIFPMSIHLSAHIGSTELPNYFLS